MSYNIAHYAEAKVKHDRYVNTLILMTFIASRDNYVGVAFCR